MASEKVLNKSEDGADSVQIWHQDIIFGFDLNFVERDLVRKSQVPSKTLQETVYFFKPIS